MADYTIDWGLPKPEADDLIAGNTENLRAAIGSLADKTDQRLTQAVSKAVTDAQQQTTAALNPRLIAIEERIEEVDFGLVWQGPTPPPSSMLWLYVDPDYDPDSVAPLPTYTTSDGTIITHGELVEWEA